jgi:hypothetical protein
MKTTIIKNVARTLLLFSFSALLITSSRAAEEPKRGDYPYCQESCVSLLVKRMADLSKEYQKNGNRLSYEEQVGEARSAYDSCIENCREARPVK